MSYTEQTLLEWGTLLGRDVDQMWTTSAESTAGSKTATL
jgi:hypothetical protein